MIQLTVVSGTKAGTSLVTRHFPVRIGRAAGNHMQLEEHGVWERHLRLDFQKHQGYILTVEPGALASVNGNATGPFLLRNGDLVEFGAARLRFWLAQVPQRQLGGREVFTWLLIASMCLVQIGLVYFLLNL